LLIAAPVVLSLGGELASMIRSCLSSRKRFGDSQHMRGPARQYLVTALVHIVAQICG
jgi:cation transporter-like permease